MPIVVHAMDEVDYQQWLDAKKVEAEELKLAMSQSFLWTSYMPAVKSLPN